MSETSSNEWESEPPPPTKQYSSSFEGGEGVKSDIFSPQQLRVDFVCHELCPFVLLVHVWEFWKTLDIQRFVQVGCSVSRTHITWSRSSLLKDFQVEF